MQDIKLVSFQDEQARWEDPVRGDVPRGVPSRDTPK